jgi:hypothetical protein
MFIAPATLFFRRSVRSARMFRSSGATGKGTALGIDISPLRGEELAGGGIDP